MRAATARRRSGYACGARRRVPRSRCAPTVPVCRRPSATGYLSLFTALPARGAAQESDCPWYARSPSDMAARRVARGIVSASHLDLEVLEACRNEGISLGYRRFVARSRNPLGRGLGCGLQQLEEANECQMGANLTGDPRALALRNAVQSIIEARP